MDSLDHAVTPVPQDLTEPVERLDHVDHAELWDHLASLDLLDKLDPADPTELLESRVNLVRKVQTAHQAQPDPQAAVDLQDPSPTPDQPTPPTPSPAARPTTHWATSSGMMEPSTPTWKWTPRRPSLPSATTSLRRLT